MGSLSKSMIAGAATDFTVFNPHEARLSDLVESFPELSNYVTQFLKSDPNDSTAEGHLKNALEGLLLGAAASMLIEFFTHSLRLLKYARIRLPIIEVRTKRHYELEAVKLDNNGEYSGKLVVKELGNSSGKETTGAQGLIGRDFENYLNQTLGGKGSFMNKGREFDGTYGVNNSIWYEAKSGRYWQDHVQAGSKGFEKFKSDVGSHLSIAKQEGASFEIHSNTPIPQHVKDWLTSKNIIFKEY